MALEATIRRVTGPALAIMLAVASGPDAAAQAADEVGTVAEAEGVTAARETPAAAPVRWTSPFEVLSRGSVSAREPRTVVVREATPEAIAAVADSGQVVARVRQVPGAAAQSPGAPEEATGSAVPGNAAASAEVVGRTHTVSTGDTLFGLARRYGVSAASIREANRMTDDVVRLGQTLVIPGEETPR